MISHILVFDNLTINLNNRVVKCCGTVVPLTKLGFDVLSYLAQNVNHVCTFDELLNEVWKYDSENGDEHMVRLAISTIRKKFAVCKCGGDALPIRTVRGVGFCFDWERN